MRMATWNLENFFAPGTSEAAPATQAIYEAKVTALVSTITAIAPDVLAVQEIGPPPALDDLAAALPGTWYHATANPDGRGIRVGLLAKRLLRDVAQVTDFPDRLGPVQVDDTGHAITSLGRPALKATVTFGGTKIHVVSTHLKSKLLTFPGGRFSTSDENERARYAVYALHRRAAEAAGIRHETPRTGPHPHPGRRSRR